MTYRRITQNQIRDIEGENGPMHKGAMSIKRMRKPSSMGRGYSKRCSSGDHTRRRNAVTAYTAAFSNLKNKNITKFKMAFRSKKRNPYPSIVIPSSTLKLTNDRRHFLIFRRTLGKLRTNLSKDRHYKHQREVKITSSARLVYRSQKWYLHIPYNKEMHVPNVTTEIFKMIALDPGARTMNVGYVNKIT